MDYQSCQRRLERDNALGLRSGCHSEFPPLINPKILRDPLMRKGQDYSSEMMQLIEKINPAEAKKIREHNQRCEERKMVGKWYAEIYRVAEGIKRRVLGED